jgi:hypothetical protein
MREESASTYAPVTASAAIGTVAGTHELTGISGASANGLNLNF